MTIRLRLFVADEYKPLSSVHWLLWVVTFVAFFGQIAFHQYIIPPPKAQVNDLQSPPSSLALSSLALGEEESLMRFLVLRLQSFDNQPGVSLPFREINYEHLGQWLSQLTKLDPKAEYPHFLMSKIYASVNDESRRRYAASWVRQQFLEAPNERWEWMAQVTNMVRYVIKDNDLATEMARELRLNTNANKVPNWARQMEAFFLENEDEFESAAAILENQLKAGEVTEPQEFSFLTDRLEGMLKIMYQRGHISEAQLLERVKVLEDLHAKFLQQ